MKVIFYFLSISILVMFSCASRENYSTRGKAALLTYEIIQVDSFFDNNGLLANIFVDTSQFRIIKLNRSKDVLTMSALIDIKSLKSSFFEDLENNNFKINSNELLVRIIFRNGRDLEIVNWQLVKEQMRQLAWETYEAMKRETPELEEIAFLMYLETHKKLRTHDDVKKIIYPRLEFILLPSVFEINRCDTLIFLDTIANPFDRMNAVKLTSYHVNKRSTLSPEISEISTSYSYDTQALSRMIIKFHEKFGKETNAEIDSIFIEAKPQQRIVYNNGNIEPLYMERIVNLEMYLPKVGYVKKVSTNLIYPMALPERNALKPFEYSNGLINQGFE